VTFFFWCKSKTLRWTSRFVAAFAIAAILFGAIFPAAMLSVQASKTRIGELPDVTIDWPGISAFTPTHDVCTIDYSGLSLLELSGLALGAFDVERKPEVFEKQMAFVFGPAWRQRWQWEVRRLLNNVPFLVYTDTDTGTVIFAFRGFASRVELNLQIELLAQRYVMPVLIDMTPFYDEIQGDYLDFALPTIHGFGTNFFDSANPLGEMAAPARAVYDELQPEKVIFTGINAGGAVAKVLGAALGERAVAFWSLPIFTDPLMARLEMSEFDSGTVTTVYNYGGLYSAPENEVGTNVGMPWHRKSDTEQDGVYDSFCTLSELCGHAAQFDRFCRAAIGSELEAIRDYLKEEGVLA
jgi:hypothetical protein